MNSTTTAAQGAISEEANRNLASISAFFIVKGLQASISHYIERLGFQLDFQGPPDDVYYGQVSRDRIAIMLKTIRPDVLPCPNHTRHGWARWDACIYTLDPDALFAEFQQRSASFVKELSFIDDGLWGFEVTDADGYVLAFFRTRNEWGHVRAASPGFEPVEPAGRAGRPAVRCSSSVHASAAKAPARRSSPLRQPAPAHGPQH
jgi:hypothetical protein